MYRLAVYFGSSSNTIRIKKKKKLQLEHHSDDGGAMGLHIVCVAVLRVMVLGFAVMMAEEKYVMSLRHNVH
jgi:hypothetical protein